MVKRGAGHGSWLYYTKKKRYSILIMIIFWNLKECINYITNLHYPIHFLRYLDITKSLIWSGSTGLQLPVAHFIQGFNNNTIATFDDLVKLQAGTWQQTVSAGERFEISDAHALSSTSSPLLEGQDGGKWG